MSCYDRLQASRQERSKTVETIVFIVFIVAACSYFGAHVLAAIQQGRF